MTRDEPGRATRATRVARFLGLRAAPDAPRPGGRAWWFASLRLAVVVLATLATARATGLIG